jgi:hypothetical protein
LQCDFHSWLVQRTLTGEIYSYRIAAFYISTSLPQDWIAMSFEESSEGKDFVEFRRKIRAAEVLSASMEQLLKTLKFTGKVSVIVQNGKVLKSGYEEGFFRQRDATG